jgi:putative transposase
MQRHRIRLPTAVYAQPGHVCSITIAVQDRRPVFGDAIVADAAIDVLRSHADRTEVPIYAYCVMPDHAHLVLAPSLRCDILTFVAQFKNLAQRAAWRAGVVGAFWQKSFWDRFPRNEEQLETVIEYVLNNPVRRGLVDDWRDYPHSGSLVFDLR